MAIIYSDLAAKQSANWIASGVKRPETTESHGRVRVAVIDTKVSVAGTDLEFVRFPAGRIRILGIASAVKATFATGGTTLKIGVSAYDNLVGTKVAADDDALMAATASASIANLAAAGASGVLLETKSGFTITGKTSANLAVNDTIKGAILYVVD